MWLVFGKTIQKSTLLMYRCLPWSTSLIMLCIIFHRRPLIFFPLPYHSHFCLCYHTRTIYESMMSYPAFGDDDIKTSVVVIDPHSTDGGSNSADTVSENFLHSPRTSSASPLTTTTIDWETTNVCPKSESVHTASTHDHIM